MQAESLGYIIAAIFGCTGFWALVQSIIQRLLDRKSASHKALLWLLHDRVYQLCEEYIQKGHITTNELRNLNMLYDPYAKLGGNGTAKALKEEVNKLPIKP